GPGRVLWDVGAGCGSVSMEASALVGRGAVYAVERAASQLDLLRENRRRFGAGNLHVVEGRAPEVLGGLPDPDAVFVGGSGGQLATIAETSAARLRPGRCLVLNLATLEHLYEVSELARAHGWQIEIVQVSISRGADVAGLTRLEALNP